MVKNIIKNGASGLYLVIGKGFVGTKAEASQFAADEVACQIKCAANYGVTAVAEALPQHKSFGVCYVRIGDRNADGSIQPNKLNPSRRRFATFDEARIHGSRFHVRKARWQAAVGSAGHIGFYVIETTDPVNSVVNQKTGLTNPAPGYVRQR